MSVKIALIGHQYSCPMVNNSVPHEKGTIKEGSSALTINGISVALEGHLCRCHTGDLDKVIQGHPALTINGIKVAFTGAKTSHGGVVIQGDSALTLE